MPSTGSSSRVALITGASRGIGKQTALALGREGVEVAIAARTTEPRAATPGTLGETEAELRDIGLDPLVVQADLARAEDVDRLLSATLERFGRVDYLINNAAYTVGRTLFTHVPDLTRDQWDKHFAINVTAPLMLIQGVWSSMVAAGGGVVVNVTSGAASLQPLTSETANPGAIPENGPAYGASKAALNRMANVVAHEGRPHGIAVVCVEPGFVLTETMEANFGDSGVADRAISPTVPARAISHICLCPDPMVYSGEVISGPDLVERLGL